ncbi:hypothetical protein [Marinomonas sp. 2405UD68-3]|uniref:hypothetical protein n=1 Tax=Marinomonas sp. 2405UD68-3 TaxID=3391835 RepID=UPI0039C91540
MNSNENEEIDKIIKVAMNLNSFFSPTIDDGAVEKVTDLARKKLEELLIEDEGLEDYQLAKLPIVYIIPALRDNDLESIIFMLSKSRPTSEVLEYLLILIANEVRGIESMKSISSSELATMKKIIAFSHLRILHISRKQETKQVADTISCLPDNTEMINLYKNVFSKSVDMRTNQITRN